MSGPGRTVWTHREHANLVDDVDADVMRILARVLITRALSGD
ncbi:hypothetical protein AB0N62_40475 [Streptomyces sp. NPDC093982]